MSKKYECLPTLPLSKDNTFSHPPQRPELIDVNDPAVNIMIDFSQVRALTGHPSTPIDDALVSLKASRNHIMLVIDGETVVGVVSSEDILGEKPMKLVQQGDMRRDEIKISAVMTPREHLMAIPFNAVKYAKVGHLLATMSEHKAHYALIIDTEEHSDAQIVHGLVYIYDMLKRIKGDLPSELKEAKSILELQRKLR